VAQWLNFPENRVMHKMASKKIKKTTIKSKFAMLGIELNKEVIASLRPLFFDTIRRGRSTRRMRSDFMDFKSTFTKIILSKLDSTIVKSRMFQGLRM